jgi:hypothetical protein
MAKYKIRHVAMCFKCFDMDVAKVVLHMLHCTPRCKYLFPTFHLFFQTYVASVFISVSHMFRTYVAKQSAPNQMTE